MISSIFPARQQVLPGSAPERPSGRRTWFSVALIAPLALIAAWLVWRALRDRGFDWRLAAISLAHVRPGWLLLAIAGIYATYWGRAIRWAVFLRPIKADPSVANLFAATVIGFTAITLVGRPGEFVRPYLIAVKERVPLPSQLAAWLLERVADLLMVLILFGFALAHVGPQTKAAGPGLRWLLTEGGTLMALAAGVLLILLVFFRHFAEPAQRWLGRSFRFLPEKMFIALMRLAETFIQGVESTRSDGALFRILVYSVVEWLLILASYWCLTTSFTGLNLAFRDVVAFLGFVALGASIQIPGIGGGIQVMAVVVLTELFGVRLEEATVFAFLIWLVTVVAVVPTGLVLSVREGLEWNKLRRVRLHES